MLTITVDDDASIEAYMVIVQALMALRNATLRIDVACRIDDIAREVCNVYQRNN